MKKERSPKPGKGPMRDPRSRIRRLLDACQLNRPDASMLQHAYNPDDIYCHHKRRFLPAYQRRLKTVRNAWLYLMIALLAVQANAAAVVAVSLFSTFLSFAFLDETFSEEDE